MSENPDKRPLPDGWIECFDDKRKKWFYKQMNVNPPRVSYAHPQGALVRPVMSLKTSQINMASSDEVQRPLTHESSFTNHQPSPLDAANTTTEQFYRPGTSFTKQPTTSSISTPAGVPNLPARLRQRLSATPEIVQDFAQPTPAQLIAMEARGETVPSRSSSVGSTASSRDSPSGYNFNVRSTPSPNFGSSTQPAFNPPLKAIHRVSSLPQSLSPPLLTGPPPPPKSKSVTVPQIQSQRRFPSPTQFTHSQPHLQFPSSQIQPYSPVQHQHPQFPVNGPTYVPHQVQHSPQSFVPVQVEPPPQTNAFVQAQQPIPIMQVQPPQTYTSVEQTMPSLPGPLRPATHHTSPPQSYTPVQYQSDVPISHPPSQQVNNNYTPVQYTVSHPQQPHPSYTSVQHFTLPQQQPPTNYTPVQYSGPPLHSQQAHASQYQPQSLPAHQTPNPPQASSGSSELSMSNIIKYGVKIYQHFEQPSSSGSGAAHPQQTHASLPAHQTPNHSQQSPGPSISGMLKYGQKIYHNFEQSSSSGSGAASSSGPGSQPNSAPSSTGYQGYNGDPGNAGYDGFGNNGDGNSFGNSYGNGGNFGNDGNLGDFGNVGNLGSGDLGNNGNFGGGDGANDMAGGDGGLAAMMNSFGNLGLGQDNGGGNNGGDFTINADFMINANFDSGVDFNAGGDFAAGGNDPDFSGAGNF